MHIWTVEQSLCDESVNNSSFNPCETLHFNDQFLSENLLCLFSRNIQKLFVRTFFVCFQHLSIHHSQCCTRIVSQFPSIISEWFYRKNKPLIHITNVLIDSVSDVRENHFKNKKQQIITLLAKISESDSFRTFLCSECVPNVIEKCFTGKNASVQSSTID